MPTVRLIEGTQGDGWRDRTWDTTHGPIAQRGDRLYGLFAGELQHVTVPHGRIVTATAGDTIYLSGWGDLSVPIRVQTNPDGFMPPESMDTIAPGTRIFAVSPNGERMILERAGRYYVANQPLPAGFQPVGVDNDGYLVGLIGGRMAILPAPTAMHYPVGVLLADTLVTTQRGGSAEISTLDMRDIVPRAIVPHGTHRAYVVSDGVVQPSVPHNRIPSCFVSPIPGAGSFEINQRFGIGPGNPSLTGKPVESGAATNADDPGDPPWPRVLAVSGNYDGRRLGIIYNRAGPNGLVVLEE